MPQRDTYNKSYATISVDLPVVDGKVLTNDGDACIRFFVSNNKAICEVKRIISPEARHSLRFSSSAKFRFSAQSGSMGPSNTTCEPMKTDYY